LTAVPALVTGTTGQVGTGYLAGSHRLAASRGLSF